MTIDQCAPIVPPFEGFLIFHLLGMVPLIHYSHIPYNQHTISSTRQKDLQNKKLVAKCTILFFALLVELGVLSFQL